MPARFTEQSITKPSHLLQQNPPDKAYVRHEVYPENFLPLIISRFISHILKKSVVLKQAQFTTIMGCSQ